MAKPLVTTRASVTVYDLCSANTYHSPAANRTPTENEVFSLRNKINFANVGSAQTMTVATASGALSNIIQILKIPKRTIVKSVSFNIPVGASETAPTNAWSGSMASVTLNCNLSAYKSASLATIVTAAKGAGGSFATTSSGGAITAFATVSASTPWTATVNCTTTTSSQLPAQLPYGGFIEWQLAGGASTSSLASAIASGTLEVIAECVRSPE